MLKALLLLLLLVTIAYEIFLRFNFQILPNIMLMFHCVAQHHSILTICYIQDKKTLLTFFFLLKFFYLFLFSLKIKVRSDYLAHSSKHICKTFIKRRVKYLFQNVLKIIAKRGSFLSTKRSKTLLQNAAAFLL